MASLRCWDAKRAALRSRPMGPEARRGWGQLLRREVASGPARQGCASPLSWACTAIAARAATAARIARWPAQDRRPAFRPPRLNPPVPALHTAAAVDPQLQAIRTTHVAIGRGNRHARGEGGRRRDGFKGLAGRLLQPGGAARSEQHGTPEAAAPSTTASDHRWPYRSTRREVAASPRIEGQCRHQRAGIDQQAARSRAYGMGAAGVCCCGAVPLSFVTQREEGVRPVPPQGRPR